MPNQQPKGFDKIFQLIGGHGRFQFYLLAICAIQGSVLVTHHIGYLFLSAVPPHYCKIDALEEYAVGNWSRNQIINISIPWKSEGKSREECVHYDLNYTNLLSSYDSFESAFDSINFANTPKKACTKWNFDTDIYESTTVTDFELVCQRRYLVASIQALYMAGVLVGSLFLGSLSDEILGRRKAVLVAVIIIIIGGFSAAFSKTYWTFVFFRFIIAIGVAGSFQSCYVLLIEYSDPQYRAFLGLVEQVPFAIGYMILPIYAYFIRNWVNLQIAFSVTILSLISYFWILPESGRWLASKGRFEESLEYFEKVARVNKKPKPDRETMLSLIKLCVATNNNEGQGQIENRSLDNEAEVVERSPTSKEICLKILRKGIRTISNYGSLLKTKELRKRSLMIWTLFVAVALVYYGIVFDSPSLTKDPFLMVFLMGVMEVPAYTIVIPFVNKCGRRPTVVCTFILAGVFLLLITIIPNDYVFLRIIVSMTGKFFISACFAVIYLLGAELFPTKIRTTGLGSAVIVGRIGSIMAPYVADGMKSINNDLPSIINGIVAILAGILALLIPETKDSDIMDQVTEVENASLTQIPKKDSLIPKIENCEIKNGNCCLLEMDVNKNGEKEDLEGEKEK